MSAPVNSNIPTIIATLRSEGLNDNAIAGALGNFSVETGGTFDPNSYNPNENALGIAQWEGPRLTALQNLAANTNGSANSLTTQLRLLVQELHSRNLIDELNSQANAGDAAAVFDEKFEGSAGTTRQERISRANDFAANKALFSGASSNVIKVDGKPNGAPYAYATLKAPLTAAQKSAVIAFLVKVGPWTQDPGNTKQKAHLNAVADNDLIMSYNDVVHGYSMQGGDPGVAVPGVGPLSWASGLAKLLAFITDVKNWERIGLFALGGMLLLMAGLYLFKNSSAVQTAGKVVAL